MNEEKALRVEEEAEKEGMMTRRVEPAWRELNSSL
jgi:hypothetical protein